MAIKEYFPNELVLRSKRLHVHADSIKNSGFFQFSVQCFFDEGKALATINHSNIVRVLNFLKQTRQLTW